MICSLPHGRGRLPIAAAASVMMVLALSSPAHALLAPPPRAAPTPALRPAAAVSGWAQFQGNAGHTGSHLSERSITKANVGQLTVAWTVPLLKHSPQAEITVASGVAYVADGHQVLALNATTGTQLWQATAPGVVLGTPSVQGGLVVIGIDKIVSGQVEGFVEALNSGTGAKVWLQQVGELPRGIEGTNAATVTTTASRAYVTLLSGQVDALALANGSMIWQSAVLPGTPCTVSQPSVSGGLVVVGGSGWTVAAFHAADGTLAWQDTFGSGCVTGVANWVPAISGSTVYAGLQRSVAAITLASGAVDWTNTSWIEVANPLSVTSQAVIASVQSPTSPFPLAVVALSLSGGSTLWQRTFSGGGVIGTATFGGLVWGLLSAGRSQRGVAYTTSTGQQVFAGTPHTETASNLPPVVVAGHVYLDLGNEVVCLALPAS
jgi:outer membrane protein assembly factor BamB